MREDRVVAVGTESTTAIAATKRYKNADGTPRRVSLHAADDEDAETTAADAETDRNASAKAADARLAAEKIPFPIASATAAAREAVRSARTSLVGTTRRVLFDETDLLTRVFLGQSPAELACVLALATQLREVLMAKYAGLRADRWVDESTTPNRVDRFITELLVILGMLAFCPEFRARLAPHCDAARFRRFTDIVVPVRSEVRAAAANGTPMTAGPSEFDAWDPLTAARSRVEGAFFEFLRGLPAGSVHRAPADAAPPSQWESNIPAFVLSMCTLYVTGTYIPLNADQTVG